MSNPRIETVPKGIQESWSLENSLAHFHGLVPAVRGN